MCNNALEDKDTFHDRHTKPPSTYSISKNSHISNGDGEIIPENNLDRREGEVMTTPSPQRIPHGHHRLSKLSSDRASHCDSKMQGKATTEIAISPPSHSHQGQSDPRPRRNGA
ncbi:hypothetical protein Nepgr_006555 [Nepenthes gracilis]|uniref:Uncharacterized protein n=1 Tax=Nepenthes gracilis TaxID=150966 RepID=A0AAD3S5P1_NEPGR|nr:hypothetical protein Nepgr_006555 [Nepenthes gracilis]